jgi:hypothetical protein
MTSAVLDIDHFSWIGFGRALLLPMMPNPGHRNADQRGCFFAESGFSATDAFYDQTECRSNTHACLRSAATPRTSLRLMRIEFVGCFQVLLVSDPTIRDHRNRAAIFEVVSDIEGELTELRDLQLPGEYDQGHAETLVFWRRGVVLHSGVMQFANICCASRTETLIRTTRRQHNRPIRCCDTRLSTVSERSEKSPTQIRDSLSLGPTPAAHPVAQNGHRSDLTGCIP